MNVLTCNYEIQVISFL